MPHYYKLSNQNSQTYGGCQWGPGVCHPTNGEGDLCGPGWTHWYTHPLLAVFLNPLLSGYDLATALLWESPEDQVAEIDDYGLKVGCTKGTTLRTVPIPEVTLIQKIAFGILTSLVVYSEPGYVKWAQDWLSGTDRSEVKAWAAARAAVAAAKVKPLDLIAIAQKAMEIT